MSLSLSVNELERHLDHGHFIEQDLPQECILNF